MELFIVVAILLVGFMVYDGLRQIASAIIELSEAMSEIEGIELEGDEDESSS